MGIAEFEMNGVLADKLDFLELEVVGNMDRQDHALPGHFILAGSTGTEAAKKWRQVTRLMTVRPQDLQFARAEFLDLRGSGGVRGHAYSTSRMGPVAKARMLTCAAIFLLISRNVFAL